MSLTRRLSRVPAPDAAFAGLAPPDLFPIAPHALSNPRPPWVDARRAWAVFGTFTDYMVRKMVQVACGATDPTLVAEKAIALIPRTNLPDSVRRYYAPARAWLAHYREAASWRLVLYDAYRLAHLDEIYRAGRLRVPAITDSEMDACVPHFARVADWLLPLLAGRGRVLLNPVTGDRACPGDADLVVGGTLYDIKAVQNPGVTAVAARYQLLGYAAQIAARAADGTSAVFTPRTPPITRIGLIFTLHLAMPEIDISAWPGTTRLAFLTRLLALT